MAEEQATPVKAASASSATQPGRKRRQDVEREEALRETGGGIARYFIRPAPIKVPVHDESAAAEPEEAPSPASSTLPGPTQMWALASPADSLPSPAASSPSRSPLAAPLALAHASTPEVSRTGAVVELPVELPLQFSEVQVAPELQDAREREEQVASSTFAGVLRLTAPDSPGSQGSFPGPTQMWGAGIQEAEFGGDLLAVPALSTEARGAAAQPPRGRRSISPTLSFRLQSPCRGQVPPAAAAIAPGELKSPQPARRSLSPTMSFHPIAGIAAGNSRRRSLSPTLSFHPPSPDGRIVGVSRAAGAVTALDDAAEEKGRPLKKQRSLSPTLSFHVPSPQRLRPGVPFAADAREVVPAGPTEAQ